MAEHPIHNDIASKDVKSNGTRKKGATATNAASLDSTNPIPLDLDCKAFLNRKGKGYIPFLNPNDNFGQLLLEAMLLSPTTLACVGSKTQYCLGNGWKFNELEPEQYKEFSDWAKCVNSKRQGLNDIIKLAIQSYFNVGNAYVTAVRGKIGSTKYIKLHFNNFLDCRLAENEDEDYSTSVLVSKEFRKKGIWNIKEELIAEIPLWSPNMFDNPWAKYRGEEHTIFHIKNEVAGYDEYGMPSNVASLPQQILEYKAARYNLDEFDNNMVIGGVMVVKGSMTEDEALKFGKKLIYQHTGDGKRGRWVIVSSEDGNIEGVEVNPFEKNVEGSFIESDKHTEEKILLANQWDGILFGRQRGNSLGTGGTEYIRSVFDIANNTVIQPTQKHFVEKFLKPLLEMYDDWMGTKWSQYEIGLQTVMPVSFLGDIDVNSIITKDEGRKIVGYKELGGERGEGFIDEGKKSENAAKPKKTAKSKKKEGDDV